MAFVPLAQRLDAGEVPSILAGPILRHVSDEEVNVFLACRAASTVTLTVFEGSGAGRAAVLSGARATVALGERLHVVVVTASGDPGTLTPGVSYTYDVDLGAGQTLGVAGVLQREATTQPLAYAGAGLPGFSLPPTALEQVRLVHASCRKPHGEGVDALTALHDIIEGATSGADPAGARPHQLFLTGDQIYADDVADQLLYVLRDAATALLSWPETLPGTTPSALEPGARAALTLDAGLTSAVPDPEHAKSHLMAFGEFAMMYLFAWSPTLWPEALPAPDPLVLGSPTDDSTLATEDVRLTAFRDTVELVRRALANVPVYMICDDHEVTDDWFMNRRWVGPRTAADPPCGVLEHPLGRRILQNGLLAFALFQAWGSTPERFAPQGPAGEPGRALLAAAGSWRGADDVDSRAIGARVGLPATLAAGSTELTRPAGALTWHYRVAPRDGQYEVLVLDGRTARTYPVRPDLAAPGLMSPAAITGQIVDAPDDDGRRLSLVVTQTPFIGLPFIEEKQAAKHGEGVWDSDVEAWSLNTDAFERLLGALADRRRRVVVLAGDVHYSFAARMTYWARRPYGRPEPPEPLAAALVQMNASSCKNQTTVRWPVDTIDPLEAQLDTDRLHQSGFGGMLWLEFAEDFRRAGWPTPRTTSLQFDQKVLGPLRRAPGWDRTPAVLDPEKLPAGTQFGSQPDWRYEVVFRPGTKGPDPARPHVNALPVGPRPRVAEIRRFQIDCQDQTRGAAGRDIVGRNNIGELRFEVDAQGDPVQVVQRTWWRARDDAQPVAATTFAVSLDPTTPAPPAPLP
ncbi:hypothetical protein ACFPK1_27490 [Actinomycetospora rhizophila]|uniref:PhoD-like phosphatase metallophosphatase domain-containing protein n=1 Tax=Actinomycetospora rhizophila TaxID=1416876 RepID=A0ABV9ZP76_9PSEU